MVRRHIQQLVDGGLSFDHIRLVQKVWAAQNNNTSRIRLAYFGGRPVGETEFAAFVDQTDLWSKIEPEAAEIGAVVDVMAKRPRVEHYSPAPTQMPSPVSNPHHKRTNFSLGYVH